MGPSGCGPRQPGGRAPGLSSCVLLQPGVLALSSGQGPGSGLGMAVTPTPSHGVLTSLRNRGRLGAQPRFASSLGALHSKCQVKACVSRTDAQPCAPSCVRDPPYAKAPLCAGPPHPPTPVCKAPQVKGCCPYRLMKTELGGG